MKKAYRTYKEASLDEARELLFGDNQQKAEIYREAGGYRLAVSVFIPHEKGFMRHVIFPDTISEMCKNPEEGQRVFEHISELKDEGNLYFRVGRLEDPIYYGNLVPTDRADIDYNEIKFPFFRKNETLRDGMTIDDYVSRSTGFMNMLHDKVAKGAEDSLKRKDSGQSYYMYIKTVNAIVYKLEKNPDGSLPDLPTPVCAPSSKVDVDRVKETFDIEPEDGQYTKGFRFTPVIGVGNGLGSVGTMKALIAGHVTEESAKRNGTVLFSTPYVFNLRSSSGEIRHDVVIDPVQALDLVSVATPLPTTSQTMVSKGVIKGSIVEYDRVSSPALMDDTYLYEEDEIEHLFANSSDGSEEDPPSKMSVSRMFRNPIFDAASTCRKPKDIFEHERVANGRIRNVYIAQEDLYPIDHSGRTGRQSSMYEPPTGFSERDHNHYISMVTKYGYLKRQQDFGQGQEQDIEPEPVFDADDIMF